MIFYDRSTLNCLGDYSMPTYQYRCKACSREFDQFQKFAEDPLTICPSCGGEIRRVIQAVGVVFKGSGWYINDSRPAAAEPKTDGSKTDSKPASDASETKSEPKTEAKTETKTETKSEPKQTKAAAPA